MSKLKKMNSEFEQIVLLIEEARSRAFHKVNEELVLLYFKVGNIISAKVSEGVWGDRTVDELAAFIQNKMPALSGFNRRGLYRMKQFFETYTDKKFVSTLATQLNKIESETLPIVTTLLTQLHWSSHLHIISKTKSAEEKIFYLQSAITEKWSVRDLERQLNSAVYERTTLANKNLTTNLPRLPQNLFKDPYIFEFLDLPEGHSEKDLDKDVKRPFEKSSIGVLLCKGKDTEVVEYAMARNISPALIADYETKLIPKNVLADKLHQLVEQLSKEEIY